MPLTAADPIPDDLRQALNCIYSKQGTRSSKPSQAVATNEQRRLMPAKTEAKLRSSRFDTCGSAEFGMRPGAISAAPRAIGPGLSTARH